MATQDLLKIGDRIAYINGDEVAIGTVASAEIHSRGHQLFTVEWDDSFEDDPGDDVWTWPAIDLKRVR